MIAEVVKNVDLIEHILRLLFKIGISLGAIIGSAVLFEARSGRFRFAQIPILENLAAGLL